MKTVSPTLKTALKNDHTLYALPKLIAEWNLNRYYNVVADNTPAEDSDGFDIEMFPIESLCSPNRPTKGINKARVGEAKVSSGYDADRARFYIADIDDIYKYWTSPTPSNASTGALTGCAPFVVYGTRTDAGVYTYQNVQANKVVVKFENSWAAPANFTVDLRVGGTWTPVFSQLNVSDSTWERTGELVLYYNGSTWRQSNPKAPTQLATITGVRTTVTSLKGGVEKDGTTTTYVTATSNTPVATTGKNAHCSVIEISARREHDLTDDLISTSDTFDLGDSSNLYPIGTVTTNNGELTLWNGENTYSADSDTSPYKGLLESNVKLSLSYLYTLPSGVEEVPQFSMYSEVWGSQKSEAVSVSVNDYSTFFQQVIPRPAMWEGLTVPEIIFRLCDSIGFTDYEITPHDNVTDFIIPVFWADGEKNMWELLDEIGKASQSAIYFDGFGTLRVKTRDAAFDDDRPVDYSLSANSSGSVLADIISAEQSTEYETNKVVVSYQNTRWSDFQNGQPVMQQVWEPDDTVALRSTPLRKTLASNGTAFYINTTDVKTWPYTGKVNIGGEIMSFEGKEFMYYTYVGATGTKHYVKVKSEDEQKKYHEMTPEHFRQNNALTGAIYIKERAIWNSQLGTHTVSPRAYSVRRVVGGVRTNPVWGSKFYPEKSIFELGTNLGYKKESDLLIATIGAAADTGYYHFGTKLKLIPTAGMTTQHAGIAFANEGTTNEDGYYVGITKSSRMTGAVRQSRNELMLYSRVNGKMVPVGGTGNRGAVVAIGESLWYEMDVFFKALDATTQNIKVWINGKLCLSANVTGANRHVSNGRFGMFAAGRTKAHFEYLYALRNEEAVEPLDDFSFLDKKSGGYVGKAWANEWVFRTKTKTRIVKKKSTKITYKYNEKFFDEFSPYVHEIREFDVKFDPTPVLHSRLYFTNDWVSSLLEYNATPFGAKFIMANTGRINAILNGEDALTFAGSGESVDQVLTVLGRPLVMDEAVTKEFKNDSQVRRRGEIVSELSSPWIQTEAMAIALGEWIVKHMSYGNDELSVEIFGNPLIEVADIVSVTYPQRDLNGQKYIVTGTSNSFETGLRTTLTLRRLNPAI